MRTLVCRMSKSKAMLLQEQNQGILTVDINLHFRLLLPPRDLPSTHPLEGLSAVTTRKAEGS
jgi:hypothetical protein